MPEEDVLTVERPPSQDGLALFGRAAGVEFSALPAIGWDFPQALVGEVLGGSLFQPLVGDPGPVGAPGDVAQSTHRTCGREDQRCWIGAIGIDCL